MSLTDIFGKDTNKKIKPKVKNPRCHTDWIHNIMSDEKYQEEWKASSVTMPNGAVIPHPDKYKREFDKIAYETMMEDGATQSRLCVAIGCSTPTILRWQKRHPSFALAISSGRLISEQNFRSKLSEAAWNPGANVNNGLIKLLASNVHGIKEDDNSHVIIKNSISNVITDGKETSKLYMEVLEKQAIKNKEKQEIESNLN